MKYNRLERLEARRTDPLVKEARLLNEVYGRIAQSESVRYAIGAMQPIDPEYTKNTYREGDRVRNQLETNLSMVCEYEYQGSVTNDTHIRARSDIDLLTLTCRYETLERPQEPRFPYKGNPIDDLINLRKEEIEILTNHFPEANVDSSGSKSITISGASLRRKVDVVPSNWFNSNDYARTGNKVYRGVQILDSKDKIRIKNFPFLHNYRIEQKDSSTSGGMRKACRLMKSLKYDSESVDLSSYDIVAIAYNMPNHYLQVSRINELSIVNNCRYYCVELLKNESLRESIKVPNNSRTVFCDEGASVSGLWQLMSELDDLIRDILEENQRSFTKLAEARVEY